MSSNNIVILTGAGISAESGLKTFRDNDGLWEQHRLEDVATPEAFARDPKLVYRFYNQRRAQLQDADVVPNQAHQALALLERDWAGRVTLVTQNVDNLHERGGSKNVLHMHGELQSARCTHTQQRHRWTLALDETDACPCCGKAGSLRPDIVWFGEMPMHMAEIEQALFNADLFVAIGTSGQVYPAAQFVAMASDFGAQTVELNLEPSAQNRYFDRSIYGPASEIVPQFVDQLLASQNN